MRRFFDWLLSRDYGMEMGSGKSFGLLVLRVGIGLMMAFGHGWGKLAGFGERAAQFADPYGLGSHITLSFAVLAEFFCSLAVVLGLFTRAAVIPLIVTMLTAGLIIHADDPFQRKEMALLYLTVMTTLLFTGPGRYSIDRLIGRNRDTSFSSQELTE
jgi:putative oxidoreductase